MAHVQQPEHIHVSVFEARLHGMEDKLNALCGLVERLVRVEERQAQNQEAIQALWAEQTRMREKMESVSTAGARSTWSVDRIERLLWLALTMLAGWFGSRFGG
jgi:uncharacterized protein HemX